MGADSGATTVPAAGGHLDALLPLAEAARPPSGQGREADSGAPPQASYANMPAELRLHVADLLGGRDALNLAQADANTRAALHGHVARDQAARTQYEAWLAAYRGNYAKLPRQSANAAVETLVNSIKETYSSSFPENERLIQFAAFGSALRGLNKQIPFSRSFANAATFSINGTKVQPFWISIMSVDSDSVEDKLCGHDIVQQALQSLGRHLSQFRSDHKEYLRFSQLLPYLPSDCRSQLMQRSIRVNGQTEKAVCSRESTETTIRLAQTLATLPCLLNPNGRASILFEFIDTICLSMQTLSREDCADLMPQVLRLVPLLPPHGRDGTEKKLISLMTSRGLAALPK